MYRADADTRFDCHSIAERTTRGSLILQNLGKAWDAAQLDPSMALVRIPKKIAAIG